MNKSKPTKDNILGKKINNYKRKQILIEDYAQKRFTSLYLSKATHNLLVAKILFKLAGNKSILELLDLEENFEAHDWVINSSYYSMYMSAQASLAKIGVKCENHTATIYALEYYFVSKSLLERKFIDMLKDLAPLEEEELDRLKSAKNIRLIAQYNVAAALTKIQASDIINNAGIFIDRMKILIRQLGGKESPT